MSHKSNLQDLAEKILRKKQHDISRGLNDARMFLEEKIKEVLSVPAILDEHGRAKYPAIGGEPPRMVTGAMQRGVTSRMKGPLTLQISIPVTNKKGFFYPWFHENAPRSTHRYIRPTIRKYREELFRLIMTYTK